MPGGIESSAPGGGVAIRTFSLMTVLSSSGNWPSSRHAISGFLTCDS